MDSTGIAFRCSLPDCRLDQAWDAIKIADQVRKRLLAQALLSLTVRQKISFEAAPLHGLIILSGLPGTGKTTLARGLANRVAVALPHEKTQFIQIDTHGLSSSALGQSQKQVTKLFRQTIPEAAMNGPCIVLLDELETLAVDRHRLSLEANPIDVHRATDAVLTGLDQLTLEHNKVLIVATTNFQDAVDKALLSRADLIEEIGLPDAVARHEIIADALSKLAAVWPKVSRLEGDIASFVKASEGLDGRRLRKAIIMAAAGSVETAQDLNRLTTHQILAALKSARLNIGEEHHESTKRH